MSSLRTKLVVYTTLIVLFVAGSISLISILLDRQHSLAAYERHVSALAMTTSEAVVDSIYLTGVRAPEAEGVRRAIQSLEARLGTENDPAIYVRIGLLELQLKRADAATKAFQNALSTAPGEAVALAGLGSELVQMLNEAGAERPTDRSTLVMSGLESVRH